MNTPLPSKMLATMMLLLPGLLFISCSAASPATEIIFVGSTPGDEPAKDMLRIPANTKVDFIRWNMVLNPDANTFVLDIVFGESQPNTLGFKGGGEELSFKGIYTIAKLTAENSRREVYQLNCDKLPSAISLVKLDDNLIHLLTAQNTLMVGNGGWSYTLSRSNPMESKELPLFATPSEFTKGNWSKMIFDGRTPCQDIAAEHPEMKVSPSCFKLKWRLVLDRDSMTLQPTTYSIRKVVDNEPRDVSGKWTFINGTPSNPNAVIIKIDPDNPETSISFLAGDDNVLFFLDKNNKLYPGNKDFSYTMNRRDDLE